MTYEEVKNMQAKFEAWVGSYIKAHPLESYREVGREVGIPMWKVVVIARNQGIRRIGGHPGVYTRKHKVENAEKGAEQS
jgi:hypothetical protein